MEKKTKYQKMEERLAYKRKFCLEEWDKKKIKASFDFCENYKKFISQSKTVRTRINYGKNILQKKGFVEFEKASAKDIQNGKIFFINREKNLLAFDFSEAKNFEEGFNLIFAHVDSPRLDLKNNPLLESEKMAFFQTHYYGGIKKYQWLTMPLSLQGNVILKNGKKQEISIGDDPKDPVFMITDLLPHLAKTQLEKNAKEFIEAEKMHLIVGSVPIQDEKIKEKVKLNILKILNEKYGIIEEDFMTAEIEIVPTGEARDVGLDRGLVAGYGHDDAVCCYTSLMGFLDKKKNKKPSILFWCDKEEIGSEGNTSAKSSFFATSFECLAEKLKIKNTKTIFGKSNAISADTSSMIDPNYTDVYDVRNNAHIGGGIILEKYVGSGGKYYTSDANIEYLGKIRDILDKEKIIWQAGTIGKIDIGGGGTLAIYFARLNMDVVDMSIGCLNLHAPWEIASKADIYSGFECYKVFYEKM